ncbi:MAG: enolase C-terminal domain-like protein [Cypionkella sp.]
MCALPRATRVPIAVGESLYSPGQFARLPASAAACSIVQVDVARIGGITPWLKVAHHGRGVATSPSARIS